MNHELILILDFDGKYNQMVAKKSGHRMYIVKSMLMIHLLKNKNKEAKGIIITGDSNNINKKELDSLIKELTTGMSVPILLVIKDFNDDIAGVEK